MFPHPLEYALELLLQAFAKSMDFSWKVPPHDLAHIVMHYADDSEALYEPGDRPPGHKRASPTRRR